MQKIRQIRTDSIPKWTLKLFSSYLQPNTSRYSPHMEYSKEKIFVFNHISHLHGDKYDNGDIPLQNIKERLISLNDPKN